MISDCAGPRLDRAKKAGGYCEPRTGRSVTRAHGRGTARYGASMVTTADQSRALDTTPFAPTGEASPNKSGLTIHKSEAAVGLCAEKHRPQRVTFQIRVRCKITLRRFD
jgi:hypothetical protein